MTLRAELDVHVAIANVPHTLDPRPDYPCTALRITAWMPAPDDDRLDPPTPETERAALNNQDWLGGRS